MTSKLFITAGEQSGDTLGARLVHALKQKTDIEVTGVGGTLLAQEGLNSLFPMTDLSVMGIAEILPKLPKILKRIDQTAQAIIDQKPDLVVTIDSPDFSFRVVKAVRKKTDKPPRMIHYVSPTVWAWRPERAQKVAKLYDGLMCLLPFEPDYYKDLNIDAAFVGHPVLEEPRSENKRSALGIPENATVLGVFFGSRSGELERIGPIIQETLKNVAAKNKDLHIVTLTLPHLEGTVQNLLADIPCPTHIIAHVSQKQAVFSVLDYAIAVSGTIGLELAVADIPHIIAYRTSTLTYHMVKNKITVKYAHLANILLDDMIVPECIQDDCNVQTVTKALNTLINNNTQKEHFATVRSMLSPQNASPSASSADFINHALKNI